MQHHLEKYEQSELEVIDQLWNQIYVDDFPGSSDTVENAFQLCKKPKEINESRGNESSKSLIKFKATDGMIKFRRNYR